MLEVFTGYLCFCYAYKSHAMVARSTPPLPRNEPGVSRHQHSRYLPRYIPHFVVQYRGLDHQFRTGSTFLKQPPLLSYSRLLTLNNLHQILLGEKTLMHLLGNRANTLAPQLASAEPQTRRAKGSTQKDMVICGRQTGWSETPRNRQLQICCSGPD